MMAELQHFDILDLPFVYVVMVLASRLMCMLASWLTTVSLD